MSLRVDDGWEDKPERQNQNSGMYLHQWRCYLRDPDESPTGRGHILALAPSLA